MKILNLGMIICLVFFSFISNAQQYNYPQNYFRHPLNIPMQLVANFGEIRANHWHMGLDIRTQQRVNLPVYAAAEGYVARVSVEPGGFGQAIYINHPNGYTTVYGHLNAFFPGLAAYVKEQQYAQQSWQINLILPPNMFPVSKGDFIAYSGSTGASEGPHVHFEIRDTKTEKCQNPLLFKFPIADAVPPTLTRLAMYDRNKSTYAQSPQIFALKKGGNGYTTNPGVIRTGSDKISFAIGAVDHFTGSTNPNGIFSASISMDGNPVSAFALTDIDYDETRYINAQLDYPYHARGGSYVQHISPLPGATSVAYNLFGGDGLLHLNDDAPHTVVIEVKDANLNTSRLEFTVQHDAALSKYYPPAEGTMLLPNNVNVYERADFEFFTTEQSLYDTVLVNYTASSNGAANALSPLHSFLSASIPSHDSITVRIKPNVEITAENHDHVVIRNVSGSRTFVARATWQQGWLAAKFRQFGTYQAFVDNQPPSVNAPPTNLSAASRIVFTPTDNFNTIRSLRVELDGQWLRFTNDKGHSWIYTFDEHFPKGEHELKVIVEDEAGNVTTRTW
ncbi:MAG TPA: peptidoglycan DD-metalloendopeptidase family protein, partial [Flavisolibacter sp.]|nr:peptidoglycan DD-metalloendopeptidase family protein [Flavisolibacter sp.]